MRKMVKRIMKNVESLYNEANTHLGSSDGAMDSDLLVSPDTERSDGVAGFGEHWGLPSQGLQHL